jgi:hypothetical protein
MRVKERENFLKGPLKFLFDNFPDNWKIQWRGLILKLPKLLTILLRQKIKTCRENLPDFDEGGAEFLKDPTEILLRGTREDFSRNQKVHTFQKRNSTRKEREAIAGEGSEDLAQATGVTKGVAKHCHLIAPVQENPSPTGEGTTQRG